MPRERRSLWGSISTSKKVNALSLKAALLYTWSIPHFDDEGFQEGDFLTLKHNICPFRSDFSLKEIPKLVEEIATVHQKVNSPIPLWVIHQVDGRIFLEDPVFNQMQTFHGVKKYPSKIKPLIEKSKVISQSIHQTGLSTTPETVDESTRVGEQDKIKENNIKENKLRKNGVSLSLKKTKIQKIGRMIEDPDLFLERKQLLKNQAKELLRDGK